MKRATAILITSCAFLAALAGTAQAGPNNGVCEHGEFCLFDHEDWRGVVLFDRPEAQIVQWGGLPLDGWAINRASSIANRTPRHFRIYAWERYGTHGADAWGWYRKMMFPGWNDVADGVRP
jgi:hypothetical protein